MAAAAVGWGHRLTALGLLVLLVGGGVALLVDQVWMARYHFYRDRLDEQQGQLERLERMAASREPIQQLIAQIQQDHHAATQYLPQSAPALAAADLQQRVRAVVEAAGGTLQSIQSLPPVEEGNAVKVTVRASMTSQVDSLPRILHGLESQLPLLFVDNLQVAARPTRVRLPSGRFADYTQTQLHVQFEVAGYLPRVGG